MTVVEGLLKELKPFIDKEKLRGVDLDTIAEDFLRQEERQSQQYAEFAIRCDREELKVIRFKDFMKLSRTSL